MSVKKFLTSKLFFKNALVAVFIVVVFITAVLQWLSVATHHGEEIPVPNLSKMSFDNAEARLNELDLEIELLDTVDFNPNFPPYSIVEQDPLPQVAVKDGRTVYVKINAGGYVLVSMPVFQQKTYREVAATLRSLGLKEGTVTYVPDLAKDVVLELSQNGRPLRAGEKVRKASVVDITLGDGKAGFVEEIPVDTLAQPLPEEEELIVE